MSLDNAKDLVRIEGVRVQIPSAPPSSCRLSAVRSGGLAIALATQLAVQRVRIAVCPWRDTKTSAELADEMRDAGVADLFGNPGHGELAVDQQLPRLVEAHLL